MSSCDLYGVARSIDDNAIVQTPGYGLEMHAPFLRHLLVLGTLVLATVALAGCPPAPPSQDECEASVDCAEGQRCVPDGDDGRRCKAACGVDTPCLPGEACVVVAGLNACQTIVENTPVGETCSADTECLSGACVDDEGTRRCAGLCTENADCSDDGRCVVLGVRRVCIAPLDDRPVGGECDDPRQCLSGQCVEYDAALPAQCTTGCDQGCPQDTICTDLDAGTTACVPAISTGETCVDATRCQGGICIADIDGQRFCTTDCSDGCPQDWFCLPDSDGTETCLPPLDDRGRGEACDDNRECASAICVTYNDREGQAFAKLCATPCSDGCLDNEICWPRDNAEDVCGPSLD